MKDKYQLKTKLAITSAALGLSSALVFGLVSASMAAASRQAFASSASVFVNSARGALVDVAQPFVPPVPTPPAEGVSPSIIYHLPTIAESAVSVDPGNANTLATRNYVTRYYNNLASYQLLGGQFGATFRQAVLPITTTFNDPVLLEQARAALGNFTNVTTAGENFNALNGFGQNLDVARPLKLVQPEVRDVFSAEFNGDFVTRQGLLTNDNVAFKVAEINLRTLAANGSLAFTYRDNNNAAQASAHNFRIIISNENNDIQRFVDEVEATPVNPSDPTDRGSITSLVNSRTLFVRDIERQNEAALVAAPDQTNVLRPRDFGNKVLFTYRYDPASAAPMLSILVVPDATNFNAATGLDFAVDTDLSDATAIVPTVLSYGLLDTSVSPRHTKSATSATITSYPFLDEPIDLSRGLEPQRSDLVYTNLPLFASTSRWGRTSGLANAASSQAYNLLRLFLLPGASFEQAMQFRGQPDASVFADLDSSFRINYAAADALVVTPVELGITRAAIEQANADQIANGLPPFTIDNPILSYSEYHNPFNMAPVSQYAQVDINLPAGVIQFNYDNTITTGNDFTVERPYSFTDDNNKAKIFFEDPFTLGDAVFTTHQQQQISILQRPDVADRDVKIISEIVRNFAGFESDSALETYIQPNSTYFNNNEAGRFAATADFKANFNQRMAEQFPGRGFAYSYKQYALGANNAITLLSASDQSLLVGRYDQDLVTMAMNRAANGALQAIEAGGQSIYNHFVAYNNALVRWSNERYGVPLTSLPAIDEYKLASLAEAEGFTLTRILERGGDEAKELRSIANLLVRLWVNDAMNVDDNRTINNVFSIFETAIPGARALIENQNDGVDTISSAYRTSKQVIFYILEPYLVRTLNRILATEVAKFEANRLLTLSTYFNDFLNSSDNKIQLASNLVTGVTVTNTLTDGMDMLAIARYGVESAANGIASLRSLFSFINTASLQNRFLTPEEIEAFGTFAATNFALLDDPAIFTDPNKRESFTQLIDLTSSVLANTASDAAGELQLSTIVTRLQNGQYNLAANPSAPTEDITRSVNGAINAIGLNTSYQNYEFYGSTFRMSFLETLVIGRNLTAIINRYVTLHDPETGTLLPLISAANKQALLDFVAQEKAYDLGSLFNFMVARNITVPRFFADSLTQLANVEPTAISYLTSPLEQSISLIVDSDIQQLKVYGNFASLSQYFLMGIGAASVVTGISAFGISFRKATRTSGKRSIAIERTFFVLVAVFGVTLIIIGVVFPGIL